MRVVCLDFETFYDADYTLKKLSTEAYIRDPRFEVICVTATVDQSRPFYAVGPEQVGKLLHQLQLDRKDTLTVAHNARFDGTIIEWCYGIHINMLACTILMMRESGVSRLTNESLAALADFLRQRGYLTFQKGNEVKLAKGLHLSQMTPDFLKSYLMYCANDTCILRDAVFTLLKRCSAESLLAMNMTLQMYTRPAFMLDAPLLQTYIEKIRREREQTLCELARVNNFASVEELHKTLRSARKFQSILETLGCDVPMKVSEKKTATARALNPSATVVMVPALAKTDLPFQELREHLDERVVALVEARLEHNSSQAESRAASLLDRSARGLFPIPLQYGAAHTGRFGGDEKINVQNLPKRTGDKTLRKSIVVPEGYEIGACDSGQVECRLLAYAAQEVPLLNIFIKGECPYSEMAATIYQEDAKQIKYYAKLDVENYAEGHPDIALHEKFYFMRYMGKETILASGYQMSGKKFALRLRQMKIQLKPIDGQEAWDTFHEDEAARINKLYRQKHPAVVRFWDMCEWVLGQLCQGANGYFGGPDGKLFYYDGQYELYGEKVPGIRLPNGFWLLYPKLKTFKDEETGFTKYSFMYRSEKTRKFFEKFIYGGSLTENLIQALAFAVLKWQAIRIHQYVPVKLNVHDEWASVYPVEWREQVKQIYLQHMNMVPPFVQGVPLACEFKFGQNYGAC